MTPVSAGIDSSPGDPCAVDWSHLSRQTGEDETLTLELLALFDRRSGDLIQEIVRTAAGARGGAPRRDLAHALRGSALAIGAAAVAAAAARYEALATTGNSIDTPEFQTLSTSVAATRRVVRARVARAPDT